MFFSKPVVELPKITAPTAAEIAAKSKPSAEGTALLKPEMTPAEYLSELEKNKMSMDSVNFLAHGLPEKDAICWAAQCCGQVRAKLSVPELNVLTATEAWLKAPSIDLKNSIGVSLGKVDFTGPASWAGQAAMWLGMPGIAVPGIPPVALVAAAVVGAVLLAAGLSINAAMPPIPKPQLQLPNGPLSAEFLAQFQKPQLNMPQVQIPTVDQLKLMKPLLPFITLGKYVAIGSVKCC